MAERVVVVGGGIIGLSCAYYLERDGFDVTVIDQNQIAAACSHGNCGYICPSHVLPLTVPGAVKMALKSLFIPNAPFRVKPSLDPDLLSWMWQFAKRCNHDSMIAAGHHLKAILDFSMQAYRDLIEKEQLNCEWRDDGLMYAFGSEKSLDAFAREDALLQSEFGVGARRFDGKDVCAWEPSLRDDLAGAFLYEGDATVRPDALNKSLRDLLVSRGVQLEEQCAFSGLKKRGAKVVALETSGGILEADHVVLAVGAWSAKWERTFQCALPVQPGKGYSVTMQAPAGSPVKSMLFPEKRVGVTPMDGYLRFGSMMEFSGYDSSIPKTRLQMLRDGVNPYLVRPIEQAVEETWYGWRPMTYDSLPIIGRTPKLSNVVLATGHNMLGLSMGAGTGLLVAGIIRKEDPLIDLNPFDPARFQRG